MYAGVKYKANGTLLQKKDFIKTKMNGIFSPPKSYDEWKRVVEIFNDTETAIYGASREISCSWRFLSRYIAVLLILSKSNKTSTELNC